MPIPKSPFNVLTTGNNEALDAAFSFVVNRCNDCALWKVG